MLAETLRRTDVLPKAARILALAVTPQRWLAKVLHAEAAGEIGVTEVATWAECLEVLNDTHCDVLLLAQSNRNPAELIEALNGGGHDLPVVILGAEAGGDAEVEAFAAGASGYCGVGAATAQSLAALVERVVAQSQLAREHRRLVFAERQRLEHEHAEAERLLAEQRALVRDLELLYKEATYGEAARLEIADIADDLPASLVAHYAELLRAYVVMGSGSLITDIKAFAELLSAAGVSSQRAVQLHLHALEELVRELGNRSARHVLNRADLLALEVVVWLAECYRQR